MDKGFQNQRSIGIFMWRSELVFHRNPMQVFGLHDSSPQAIIVNRPLEISGCEGLGKMEDVFQTPPSYIFGRVVRNRLTSRSPP
jgi:hypothetical protein